MFIIVAKRNGAPCPEYISIQAKIEQRWRLLQPTGARPHSDTLKRTGASAVFSSSRLSEPAWMELFDFIYRKRIVISVKDEACRMVGWWVN